MSHKSIDQLDSPRSQNDNQNNEINPMDVDYVDSDKKILYEESKDHTVRIDPSNRDIIQAEEKGNQESNLDSGRKQPLLDNGGDDLEEINNEEEIKEVKNAIKEEDNRIDPVLTDRHNNNTENDQTKKERDDNKNVESIDTNANKNERKKSTFGAKKEKDIEEDMIEQPKPMVIKKSRGDRKSKQFQTVAFPKVRGGISKKGINNDDIQSDKVIGKKKAASKDNIPAPLPYHIGKLNADPDSTQYQFPDILETNKLLSQAFPNQPIKKNQGPFQYPVSNFSLIIKDRMERRVQTKFVLLQ